MRLRTAVLCLTSCFILSACATQHVVTALKPPPERLICHLATRPTFPPEIPVDWGQVLDVRDARAQQEGYVSRQRVREQVVARYILDLESKLFQCSSNMIWISDFFAGLPAE